MKRLYVLITLIISFYGFTQAESYQYGKAYYILNEEYRTAQIVGFQQSVTSISIPEEIECDGVTYTVTSIGSGFAKESRLDYVSIPNSIISIGANAFRSSWITSVIIPASVREIGEGAFSYTSYLNKVTVSSDSILKIGYDVLAGSAWYKKQADGIVYLDRYVIGYKGTNPLGTSITFKYGTLTICDKLFPYGNFDRTELASNVTDISFPTTLMAIGEAAFAGCKKLVNFTIPESVSCVGYGAFNNTVWYSQQPDGVIYVGNVANSVKGNVDASIQLREGTISISDQAFYRCSTIMNLKIPEGVVSIGSNLFSITNSTFTSSLTSVSIPKSMKRISSQAFARCDNLETVQIADVGAWSEIYFEPNVEFSRGTALENELVKSAQTSNPLSTARKLNINGKVVEKLVVPNGTTKISPYAFDGAECLSSVVIPNTVKSIGKFAFYSCINLYSVTSFINIPFRIDETVFTYSNNEYPANTIYMIANLYVPRGRDAFYRQVEGWKLFYDIETTETKYKLTYMVDGVVYKTYEIQATDIITPEPDPFREGYDFSGWQNLPSVMPNEDVVVTGYFVESTGITVPHADLSSANPRYYDLMGHRFPTFRRGINIVHYQDGSRRIVMVK